MRVAVLALQGAFEEHEQMLLRLGVETFEVRNLADWAMPKHGLIIPGGESTTQKRLLGELGLMEPVRRAIVGGLPVFGTCAGLILLADSLDGEPHADGLATMSIDVRRNAYGRQLGSFHTEECVDGVGERVPMTFIRAPYINRVQGDARATAWVDGHVVAAEQGSQLVAAFHPELNDDTRMHARFLRMIRERAHVV